MEGFDCDYSETFPRVPLSIMSRPPSSVRLATLLDFGACGGPKAALKWISVGGGDKAATPTFGRSPVVFCGCRKHGVEGMFYCCPVEDGDLVRNFQRNAVGRKASDVGSKCTRLICPFQCFKM